jgi:hypothetical protein
MASKSKRVQVKVGAIVDARGSLPDGTPIASLRLGREHLLDRQLRMLPGEVEECCILGGDAVDIAADLQAKVCARVPGRNGLAVLADALAATRSGVVLLFAASQPFPDAGDARRVLTALRRRPAAGVFHPGQISLARAQGETVLSATPPDHYWTAQSPLGFDRNLLGEVLAAVPHTVGADAMGLCDLTLRLGHAIGLVEGRRSGFSIRDPYDWMLAQALASETRVAA